jgi:hypothetical protein
VGPLHLFRFSLEQASLRAERVTAFCVREPFARFLATVSQAQKLLVLCFGEQNRGGGFAF